MNALSQADFLVIGGGAVGLMTALELNKTGAQVAVANSGEPSASWAAGGILSPLPPWQCAPTAANLAKNGASLYGNIISKLQGLSNINCGWRRLGMLVLTENTPQLTAWRKKNHTHTVAAHEQAPLLSLPPNAVGEWLPNVSQLHPPNLLRALSAVLQKQGVRFYPGAIKLQTKKNTVSTVILQHGKKMSADTVILCAGARSSALCPPPKPPLVPKRGQILLYAAVKPLLCAVLREEDNLYLLPRRDGTLLVGSSDEEVGFDHRTFAPVIADLHRRAAALFPCLAHAPLVNAWAGLRPSLPDGVPIIARHPLLKNLYLNVGHTRYGLTMAPAAARHMLDIIRGRGNGNAFAFRTE